MNPAYKLMTYMRRIVTIHEFSRAADEWLLQRLSPVALSHRRQSLGEPVLEQPCGQPYRIEAIRSVCCGSETVKT